MSERTTIGGVTYESIGSSDSNLLLKCNGTARIQWGTKLIDLIKNGKICSNDSLQNTLFKGMIVMYSGIDTIPEGWAICDGQSYDYEGNTYTTPDLTNQFIKNNQEGDTQNQSNLYSVIFIIKL